MKSRPIGEFIVALSIVILFAAIPVYLLNGHYHWYVGRFLGPEQISTQELHHLAIKLAGENHILKSLSVFQTGLFSLLIGATFLRRKNDKLTARKVITKQNSSAENSHIAIILPIVIGSVYSAILTFFERFILPGENADKFNVILFGCSFVIISAACYLYLGIRSIKKKKVEPEH